MAYFDFDLIYLYTYNTKAHILTTVNICAFVIIYTCFVRVALINAVIY